MNKKLKIFKVENLGDLFSQTVIPLKNIPRKVEYSPNIPNTLFVLSSSHRRYPESKNKKMLEQLKANNANLIPVPAYSPCISHNSFPTNYPIIAPEGTWASSISLISTMTLKPTYIENLKNNEVALCITTAKFDKYKDDNYLLVGTAANYKMNPQSYSAAYVRTYLLSQNNKKLEILHVTTVDALPLSITPYKGMVLAGIGYMVRLYDIG